MIRRRSSARWPAAPSGPGADCPAFLDRRTGAFLARRGGGTITGLTYATTALDLLQALTESTYQRLAQIADLLERNLGRFGNRRFRRHPPFVRVDAAAGNVLGRPIRACPEPEASLRGAALHVWERLGKKASPLPRGSEFRPDRAAARLYAEARTRQIALEQKLA